MSRRLHSFALVSLVATSLAAAAPVVLVDSGPHPVLGPVQLTGRFYGLPIEDIPLSGENSDRLLKRALAAPDTLVLVVNADALPALSPQLTFAALASRNNPIPLLILCRNASNSHSVSAWTGIGLAANSGSQHWQLHFSRSSAAAALSGISYPFFGMPAASLETSGSSSTVLLEARHGSESFPVMAEVARGGVPVFVAAVLSPIRDSGADPLLENFSAIAPLAMFLCSAAGDRAWHSPGVYANFTVDDPWLSRRYGSLDYQALLAEMQRHDFHTTIAFIPWNYDRSDPGVVSLFRSHPDRFSIAIHGNNHDHREFGDYRTHPLDEQYANLRQALARMRRFEQLTGIPYERVMVFPHAVSPEATFRLVKTLNFLGTVNSENVPLDALAPADPLFFLRPETLAYQNTLSVQRYSVEIPVSSGRAAVQAFIGNPLLFYAHQPFFKDTICAFDSVADMVHGIAPATHWTSLGQVLEHLYLLRLRSDGDYDVMAYSPRLTLANPENRTLTFHIRKPEDFKPEIRSLFIDGRPAAWHAEAGELVTAVPLGPHQTSHIEIAYRNDFNPTATPIARSNLRVALLRYLSDFRDIALSESDIGRRIAALYARPTVTPLEATIGLLFTATTVLLPIYFSRKKHFRCRVSSTVRKSG
ncbi:MAG: hypothetical protein JOY54_08115 [Acidobacteriaceae bacterium]|nr:hypothetical protein [Acidobacteriaceae bacterium]